jgi:hypothetical protein
VEDLADEVHRSLDDPGPFEGSGASISMGAGPASSWPFAPGGSSEPGDPMTPWSREPMAAFRDWDSAAASASVSSAGRRSWDPDSSAAPGSSVGHGSRDPGPSAHKLPSSCRACGFGRSATSTMLTASEVAAM